MSAALEPLAQSEESSRSTRSARPPRSKKPRFHRGHRFQILIAVVIVLLLAAVILLSTRMRARFDVYQFVLSNEARLNQLLPEVLTELRAGEPIDANDLRLGPVDEIELFEISSEDFAIRFDYPERNFPERGCYGFYYSYLDEPRTFGHVPASAELEENAESQIWTYRDEEGQERYFTRRIHKHWFVYSANP
ncbi:MAG: hypothetical protein QM296_09670 [Bacillota bacterium]|nr:hypothetical protein [Bacillota bacterium]